jgi:hypothetical protein
MGPIGAFLDAMAESFFATLETEGASKGQGVERLPAGVRAGQRL